MSNQKIGIGVAVVGVLCIMFVVGRNYFQEKAARQKQEQMSLAAQKAAKTARIAAEKVVRLATEKAALTLHKAFRYADSVGIDTIRYVAKPNSDKAHIDSLLTRVLLEMRYGKKPSRVVFSVKETIDSAWVHSADAALAPRSLASLSTFLPYSQLLGHYSRIRKKARTNPAVKDSLRQIRQTLNFYRYIHRFNTDQFVLVNIPAGELNVFDRTGDRLLPMQVIAGKPDKRTPCMTTYIQSIVMYPQWNVPENIAVNEMLPRIKRNISYINNQNLQILDASDHEVDPSKINWKSLSTTNFPYRVRQASGCENSLGLLKFNLANPLAIYLHDTNTRDLFTQTADRWRSHGCVRVQKPVELANLVLGDEVFDDEYMDKCLFDQKPKTLTIPKRFPVFITYNVADVDDNGKLRFYKDVYGLDAK